MSEKKYFFYRDNSPDSTEAKQLLDSAQIEYQEIFSEDEHELPCLLIEGSAIPFSGLDGITLYLSFLEPEN